jgi:hypothetical protein
LEAVLIAPMLRPLFAGIGFAGGYEVTLLAQEVAAADKSGFAFALARQLQGAP